MPTGRFPEPLLERLTRAFNPDWLIAQRWYRSKSQPITSVALIDAARLPGHQAWLLLLEPTDPDGAHGRYLIPAVDVDGDIREPLDGEGVWRGMVELMASGAAVRGEAGAWVFDSTPALSRVLPGGAVAVHGLGERRLRSEQSNTSVSLDDRLILKVYRLVEAGNHPEVEINAFLTENGFPHAPSLAGKLTYQADAGPPSAAAILQEFVPSDGDAWGWVQGSLASPDGGAGALAGMGQIGRLTAALHSALASRPETAGFPVRAATDDDTAAWRRAADDELAGALAVLSGETHDRLNGVAVALRRAFLGIQGARGTPVTRIHGDFHLGQLLRMVDGFSVIDFEGEPARPLAQRSEPATPLRDVAGMLRSIDYAAHVAQRGGASIDSDAWVGAARDAYLSGYGRLPARDKSLLRALETEKACYEVRYEANNRPDWVWLPLAALERLAAED